MLHQTLMKMKFESCTCQPWLGTMCINICKLCFNTSLMRQSAISCGFFLKVIPFGSSVESKKILLTFIEVDHVI